MKAVTLTLTLAEAVALGTLAGEGAEGILTDPGAAQAYIGNKRKQDAARKAMDKLNAAIKAASTEKADKC